MSWRRKSYDEVPALSVRGHALRWSLRRVTLAWMFGIVWMSLVAGSRMTLFARALGFKELHFGLLAAVPYAAILAQMAAAALIERTGLTKHQFLDFATVSRLLWIAIAGLPLLTFVPGVPGLPAAWAAWGFLALLAVSLVLGEMSGPAWMTWMGDMIPRRIRGRYLAVRSRLSAAVKIPIIIGLSILLDWLTRRDPSTGRRLEMTLESQPALFWTICLVFLFAGVVGAIDILLFRRVREILPTSSDVPDSDAAAETPSPPACQPRAWARVRAVVEQYVVDPMRDRVFRGYVIFGMVSTFSMTVGSQYMWLYLLEDLGFSQLATDSLFMVLASVVGILSVGVWGRLIDRWGRRPVMIVGAAMTIGSVSPYFFAGMRIGQPQGLIDLVNWLAGLVESVFGWGDGVWLTPDMPVGPWLIMSVAMVLGGIGWGGVMLAQQNLLLGFADGPGRSRSVATYWVLLSVGGLVGGLTGGYVADVLAYRHDDPFILGPFVWHNYHATFALALLARIAATVIAATMSDPGSTRVRHIARYFSMSVYNNVLSRFLLIRRTLPRGRRNGK